MREPFKAISAAQLLKAYRAQKPDYLTHFEQSSALEALKPCFVHFEAYFRGLSRQLNEGVPPENQGELKWGAYRRLIMALLDSPAVTDFNLESLFAGEAPEMAFNFEATWLERKMAVWLAGKTGVAVEICIKNSRVQFGTLTLTSDKAKREHILWHSNAYATRPASLGQWLQSLKAEWAHLRNSAEAIIRAKESWPTSSEIEKAKRVQVLGVVQDLVRGLSPANKQLLSDNWEIAGPMLTAAFKAGGGSFKH
jgi:hypothetical protein